MSNQENKWSDTDNPNLAAFGEACLNTVKQNMNNHQEKLQALTTAIQLAVPSVMELKFGCRLNHEKKGKLIFISEKFCQNESHDGEYGCNNSDYCNNLACYCQKEDRVIYGNHWSPYEILGSPITLEDVFEWMMTVPNTMEDTHELIGRWQFNKTLSEQNPECIDFLFSLIK